MREPDFWWGRARPAVRIGVAHFAVYGAIAGIANEPQPAPAPAFQWSASAISPLAAPARPRRRSRSRSCSRGRAEAVLLSRGYGGKLAGPLKVDPTRHQAQRMSATSRCCSRERRRSSSRVTASRARTPRARPARASIVMDDGLQNPSLHKDRSIAVVDGRRGIGNGRVFPAGPLRAPLRTNSAARTL